MKLLHQEPAISSRASTSRMESRPLDSVKWHIVDHHILAFYCLLPYLVLCMMLSSWKF